MSRYRWVYHEDQLLEDVGVLDDGTLHNPRGYGEALVRAAVQAADERRRARRSRGAVKAVATKGRRVERRVYEIVERLRSGGRLPESRWCAICRKRLDDPESIARAIGSDCWQRVLDVMSRSHTPPETCGDRTQQRRSGERPEDPENRVRR